MLTAIGSMRPLYKRLPPKAGNMIWSQREGLTFPPTDRTLFIPANARAHNFAVGAGEIQRGDLDVTISANDPI
jgi:hypothetical protein